MKKVNKKKYIIIFLLYTAILVALNFFFREDLLRLLAISLISYTFVIPILRAFYNLELKLNLADLIYEKDAIGLLYFFNRHGYLAIEDSGLRKEFDDVIIKFFKRAVKKGHIGRKEREKEFIFLIQSVAEIVPLSHEDAFVIRNYFRETVMRCKLNPYLYI